jgi:hypothetical protein
MDQFDRVPIIVDELVRVAQPATRLHRDINHVLQRKGLPFDPQRFHDLLEVRPIDELHHDEEAVVRLPDVEDADDVRVCQPCPEPRLVEKHPNEIRVRGEVGQNALDSDAFLEPLDAGGFPEENLGHSPGFKLFEQVISLIAHPRSSALP